MRRYLFRVLLCVILVTFALRVFRLDFQSLWYDEAFSVYLAHFNLGDITARTAADIQPPLYYYLLHFWIALTGDSEFAVRFLSLFFGVLTVPLIYALARRLFALPGETGEGSGGRVGVLAALFAMVAPLYVWYSQEARMYTLITFLLLLSSYALTRMLALTPDPSPVRDGREAKGWGCFILANIAAVYTHYFAFAVIAFQLLWVLLSCIKFQGSKVNLKLETLKPATRSLAAIFAAFLPWLPFVVARLNQDASYWQGALKMDEALRHILINFTMGESVLEAQAQWIAVGWLALVVVGWLGTWVVRWLHLAGARHLRGGWVVGKARQKAQVERQKYDGLIFSTLYLLVPLALLLVLFYRNPKFNARYLMIASPSFLLLLAAGLERLWSLTHYASRITFHISRFAFFVLPFAFILFTSLYSDANAYFDPAFSKASFREVAQYIDAHIQPGEAIILTSGHLFPAFDYYYHGDARQIRLPDDPTLNIEHVLGYETANTLNQTLTGARGAWVVLWQDEVVDPNGFIPMLLASRGQEQKIEGTGFYQVRLRHWTLPPDPRFAPQPDPTIVADVNFKNQLRLLGATPTPASADVGASFNLYWQALDTLGEDYQVALRVVDAAGNLWGKQDCRPAGYTYPTTRWGKGEKIFGAYTVPLLPGTPPGEYTVEVTVYTAANQSGLDILAPNGAPMGKTFRLGSISVLPATKPPTLAALNIQNTISQPLGPFTLLGYQLRRDQASAGETIPLLLFWRADEKPAKDYTFRVQFGNVSTDQSPISNLNSPTSTWRAGDIIRGQYNISVPADAKEGATNLRVVFSDGSAVDLAPFTVVKSDRVFVKPNMQFAQVAHFGSAIALSGYDLSSSTFRPGQTLEMTLYWQAQGKTDKPYTIFVHLLDKDNQVAAQKDAQPVNGARPTTGWVANEYIADTYLLTLKPDAPPGKYQIEVGWYDASDFSRLQVLDANGVPVGDHIILSNSLFVQ